MSIRSAFPALVLLLVLGSRRAPTQEYWGTKSTLGVQVTLIAGDLSLRPVPKQPFIITRVADADWKLEVSTAFTGDFKAILFPGRYLIRSVKPVQIEEKVFIWEVPFTVQAGLDLKLELSNDNAKPYLGEAVSARTERLPLAGEIFQRVGRGVATLETDTGHGSTFLVDRSGLLLTNEHVVSGSRALVVAVDFEHRYPARLIASNRDEDLAVIAIHPSFAAALPVVPLASDPRDHTLVKTGEQVFAIGSPNQQRRLITSGMVSEVGDGVIISDVAIDHGSSGGPMLNSRGEAIGINTFGEGRAVSGTLRIWKAETILQEAREKLKTEKTLSDQPMPAYPRLRYPLDALRRRVLAREMDIEDYGIESGDFMIMVLSPPAQCYMEHYRELEAERGRNRRRGARTGEEDTLPNVRKWGEDAGQYPMVVRVMVVPRIKATAGSRWMSAFLGTRLHFKFAGDLDRLSLARGGQEVPVLRSGRYTIKENSNNMNDSAYAGYAEYAPAEFLAAVAKGEHFEIRLVNEKHPDRVKSVRINRDLLEILRKDLSVAPAVEAQSAPH